MRCLVFTFILALFTPSAFAYIDPNMGGFVFQLLAPLVAIALTIWMFFADQVKAVWRSFHRVFSRKIHQEKGRQ